MEKCTTKYSDLRADRTTEMFVGSANPAIPRLTESEKSKLMVIRREVGRGYAITMQDLRFLVEIVERCGL